VEIDIAFSSTCWPPCDAAQTFKTSIDGKWISAIRWNLDGPDLIPRLLWRLSWSFPRVLRRPLGHARCDKRSRITQHFLAEDTSRLTLRQASHFLYSLSEKHTHVSYLGLLPQPFLPPQVFLCLPTDLELPLWDVEPLEVSFSLFLFVCWSVFLSCCATAVSVPAIRPEKHAAATSDLKLAFTNYLRSW
jgi:hypothetical protein